MVVYNFDKVIRVKLLLPAGSANKNVQLRTIFNNYRSTFYDSFVDSFNSSTSNLAADILVRTIVYIPTPGSNAVECRYEVLGPSLYSLFKKFNFLQPYYKTGLVFFKVSLFDLYKMFLVKDQYMAFGSNIKSIFSTFLGSFFSYNIHKKNLLFVLLYLKQGDKIFYSMRCLSRFYRTFFKL